MPYMVPLWLASPLPGIDFLPHAESAGYLRKRLAGSGELRNAVLSPGVRHNAGAILNLKEGIQWLEERKI